MGNKLLVSPWYDTLQQLKSEIFKGLRVCVPGSIYAVNATDGTVDVQIGLMQAVEQPNPPFRLDVTYPLLTHCPVFTTQGGGIGAVMPVKEGDGCLVIFSDRAIDAWFEVGQPVPLPTLSKMHDISDGFVLVGVNPQTSPLNTPLDIGEGGLCETKNAFGAKVAINPVTHKVTIQNGTEDLFTAITALTTTLTALITALSTLGTTGTAVAQTVNPATVAALLVVQGQLTAVQAQFAGLLY